MSINKRYHEINKYCTLTTNIEILEVVYYPDEFEELLEEVKFKVKFKTTEGYIFNQMLVHDSCIDSVFCRIMQVAGLDIGRKELADNSLVGLKINAVIATKSSWNKAFVVAVF